MKAPIDYHEQLLQERAESNRIYGRQREEIAILTREIQAIDRAMAHVAQVVVKYSETVNRLKQRRKRMLAKYAAHTPEKTP
jgi:chromosome segregation ATPase